MSFVAIKKLRSLRLSNNNKGFTITNKWACKSLWNRLLDLVDWFSGLLNQVLSGFNRRSRGRFSSIATGFNRTSESQFDRYSGFLIQVLSGFNRRSSGRFDRFSSGLAVVPLVSTGRVRVSLTDLVGSIAENTIRFYKVAFTDTVNCVPVRADIYSISKVVAKCFLWNSSALLGTLCSILITRTLGCDAKLDCQACSFA